MPAAVPVELRTLQAAAPRGKRRMRGALSAAVGWLALAILWLYHWLPLPVQALGGRAFGTVLWRVASSRRAIALRNLQLCLPELGPAEHERIGRALFQWFSRSVLERGL